MSVSYFIYWRCFSISKESVRINEEIRVREVRVTNAEGEQLGIMQTRDALRMAVEQHLDLVEIAPKAKPPVCRIMDFGKYRYEQQKREKALFHKETSKTELVFAKEGLFSKFLKIFCRHVPNLKDLGDRQGWKNMV